MKSSSSISSSSSSCNSRCTYIVHRSTRLQANEDQAEDLDLVLDSDHNNNKPKCEQFLKRTSRQSQTKNMTWEQSRRRRRRINQ